MIRRFFILSVVFAVLLGIALIARNITQSHTPQSVSYLLIALFLIVAMSIILAGCEIFANGVECLGDRMNLSHATTGSLLAAVGTALPETLLPILALLFGTEGRGEGIAVGAILGAPFMLGTLAMFLLGVVTFGMWVFKRRQTPALNVNAKVLNVELLFFVPTMVMIAGVSFLNIGWLKYATAMVLVMIYAGFVKYAMGHVAEEGEDYSEHFYFGLYLYCPRNMRWIVLQVAAGLIFIIAGAQIFVEFITEFSIKSGMPALILSLLIAPVATELPEKFNSISWALKKKDTLAMGNISGAMVFQSTIPVSIGLLFTSWSLNFTEFLNIIFAASMAAILLCVLKWKKTIPSWSLAVGGIFYFAYLVHIFY